MREKTRRYLRENWGAPFVVAFIILLIASSILLTTGRAGSANSIGVYAFYALVLGVILQIASYIKYGEREEQKKLPPYTLESTAAAPPGRRAWSQGKKRMLAVI
ncbi:MAG: hypothetical protein ACREBS_09510, partial [Nitrososphaerales archaeon]